MKKNHSDHELSRPLQVDKISMGGLEETIVASPTELKALTKRFGLLDLSRLEARLSVDHAEGRLISVTGSLSADVVQECVVTLEPLPATVSDKIDVLFAPAHILEKDREGPLTDLGDAEAPEPIINGVIDLGELVSQHLAMALNPYPRKPGASFETVEVAQNGKTEGEKAKPFAILEALKGKGAKNKE